MILVAYASPTGDARGYASIGGATYPISWTVQATSVAMIFPTALVLRLSEADLVLVRTAFLKALNQTYFADSAAMTVKLVVRVAIPSDGSV